MSLLMLLSLFSCRNTIDKDTGSIQDTALVDQDGDGVPAAQDCDDDDPAVYPDAEEICDGVDNNCDGVVDEDSATDAATWYGDLDQDGYGDDGATTVSCQQPPDTAVVGGDCDDSDPAYNPGAEEDDCTDPNDYNCDGSVGYADGDGDGWAACQDCDDSDPAVSPDGVEVCNGLDDDCDGDVDEDEAADAGTWYADSDGDGYGDPATATTSCEAPSGYISEGADCDDGEAAVNPAATEMCNGVDDNCDGSIDPDSSADAGTWYADSDGDSYGDAGSSSVSCDAPSGYLADATDCDDSDAAVNPGASEVCNGVDDDCDGSTQFEADPDADGLLACEEALWLKSDGASNNDPSGSGSYGGSEGAALLTARGVTWSSSAWSSGTVTSTLLADYGLLILYGNGSYGALSTAESSALDTWVYDGGSLLYMGYHPDADSCASLNALPAAFGLSCADYSTYWSGATSTFTTHDVTSGLGSISGMGGELWSVSSPAQSVATYGGDPFVIVAEYGSGKVVAVSDEWAFYDAGSGSADISVGDNELLVDNIWAWLLE